MMLRIKYWALSGFLLLAAAPNTWAQTADEIVQRHLESIGGAEGWHNVRSLIMKGTTNVKGATVPLTIHILNKEAIKITFTNGGLTGFQMLKDQKGWNYSPMQGDLKPHPMEEADIVKLQATMDIAGPLCDYKAKGSKVNYMGMDDANGVDCFRLRLTYSTGKEEYIYIQKSNFYHILSKTKEPIIHATDTSYVENVATYSNFKKMEGGLVFPLNMDDNDGTIIINSIELNKDIDSKIFDPTVF